MFTVYVLWCADDSIYIGHTEDLQKRLRYHRGGKVKWTKSRLPVHVAYTEEYITRAEAAKREKALKTGWGRQWLKRKLRNGAAGRCFEPI